MRRAFIAIGVVGTAALLGGCPVYSSPSDYQVCTANGCFDCPDPNYSGMCIPWACNSDSDCTTGALCSSSGQCVTDDGGAPSDCGSSSACQAGYVCKLSGGAAQCVLQQEEADASPSADAGVAVDAAADAGQVGEASLPSEAGSEGGPTIDASSDGPPAMASMSCSANGDCSGDTSCVDGQCVAEDELCSDATQCVVPGESCVDGRCVPTCGVGSPCPTGYACNFTLGVCDINPAPCVGSGTSSCQGGAVCVENRCVAPCASSPATASCSPGQVCVQGGCIPDERARFACKNDGQSGLLANVCDDSSVCLHHDCYAQCDADGGGCGTAACKEVTVKVGTYAVCATPSTLGSDCDWASGALCAGGGTCVDGYCK